MNGNYRVGDIVLGEWKLAKLLGQGSYGKVFEGEREDFGIVYTAAIKIITIPQSQSEVQSTRAEGLDDESITSYFRSMVEEMVQEFGIMSKLKGTSNIVSYEDHRVIPHSEGIGWDIIIRMECLRPMLDYMGKRVLEPKEVAKIGVDMCKALELCEMQSIIHRDIKPENMFVNDLGDFKLGDFGIARTFERKTSNMSKKGTYTYMAPEIYKEEPYDARVDIYSLGIVLYRFLNNNRAPFLPLTGPMTHGQREQALMRRISGAPLPPPCGATGTLADIVLKACAYRPEDRWQTPGEMRVALERWLLNGDEEPPKPEEEEEEEEGTVFAPRPARPIPAKAPAEEVDGTVSAFSSSLPRRTQAPASAATPAPAPAVKTPAPAEEAPISFASPTMGPQYKPIPKPTQVQTPAPAPAPRVQTPEPAPIAQTPAPEFKVQTPAPAPVTQTPAPAVKVQTPAPAPAPPTPAPAVKIQTPAPAPAPPTPAPAVKVQAPVQEEPISFASPTVGPKFSPPAYTPATGKVRTPLQEEPISFASPTAGPKSRPQAASVTKPAAQAEKASAHAAPVRFSTPGSVQKPEKKQEPAPAPAPEKKETPAGGKSKRPLILGGAALVLVIAVLVVLFLTGVLGGSPDPTPTPSPTPTAASSTPAPSPTPDPGSAYVDDNWDDTPIYGG